MCYMLLYMLYLRILRCMYVCIILNTIGYYTTMHICHYIYIYVSCYISHSYIHTCCAMSGVSDPSISPQNTHVRKGMFTPKANESSVCI